MHSIFTMYPLLLVLLWACPGCSQPPPSHPRLVGICEGCEAIFEYGDRKLTAEDTLPDFDDPGPRLKVSGTVYQPDGHTPAAGVILYVYHTNQEGIYPTRGNENGWARRHGYIRGWMKTDARGHYAFYTLKPAPYPGRDSPAHIHPIVLEPDGNYYWLEEYVFAGDPLLKPEDAQKRNPQGGPGFVLHPEQQAGMLVAERDIILGKNVPGYR